jgi:hypothetical protein
MTEFSRVREGIPSFVRDYLDLKDNDELHWDQGVEGNIKYYRLLKRDYNVTGSIDFPTEEKTNQNRSDFQVRTV